MTGRRELVERDFGLRPKRGVETARERVPLELLQAVAERLEDKLVDETQSPPTETSIASDPAVKPQDTSNTTPSENSNEDDRSSTVSTDPNAVFPGLNTVSPNLNPESPLISQEKPSKRRRSDESQRSNKSSPTLPAHYPPCPMERPGRAGIELWRQGCREVQRPDGTVEGLDVVNWLMTRKGGVANPWPQLNDGLKSISNMRKETIDFNKIARQREEEEEAARLKEERRLANKRRYRPRGQIAKEKAEQRAAAAAAAAAKQAEQEAAEAEKNLQEETKADNKEPEVKKVKMDATL
ncbi:hypothetical protein FALBO_8455 [Fusarium albosuccineum]|uniref:Uncharacterized protein n=1 Tax=Fusarium albosuccineum TaxID=1237068 RepID=A0A8H4L9H2_9HYPO|nr:hypothetical protein FALBO_8455 [Fusarium albosuccineum]